MSNRIIVFLMIIAVVSFYSCGGSADGEKTEGSDKFETLISYIESGEDFMNTPDAPGNLGITEVLNSLGPRMHIIDLRNVDAYERGHIQGAVNVKPAELLNYFENSINPSAFDTIALISYDGQDALFAVPLLRLLGYNNVFGLRFGMAWHKDFTEIWKTKLSYEYEDRLSFGESPEKIPQSSYPVVMSEIDDAYDILRERAQMLLEQPSEGYRINAAEVFANPDHYYIICYWNEKAYNIGHIPGSVLYIAKESLTRDTGLKTLPIDKTIVLYCNSGHHSSSAAAYLRLLGYDAKTLSYGTNSFMYNIHRDNIDRGLYSDDVVFDYPLADKNTKGELPVAKPVKITSSQGGC